uniref:Fructose-1,6-bisphosphatase n=1 Tax=Geobacillus sp. (strain Y4.1MC1) TaxID=581103 RepID=A0A7U4DLM9_GEOS0
MKHLLMEFMKVTEKAAIASLEWIGRGDKIKADGACTAAMRSQLNQIKMNGVIVIGEGEMDEAPMLYIGERVGTGEGPDIDIAVDPLDGTNLVAKGQGNSIAVIAAAPRGKLLCAPDIYMEKISVGPEAVGCIDLDVPVYENLKNVAKAKNKRVSDLRVMVQERERHEYIIDEIQRTGASVILFSDVDVTAAIAPAISELNVDMFIGIGGAPEGVVAAVALKGIGGELQGRLLPQDEKQYGRCLQMGLENPHKKLLMNDLIKTDDCIFVATGITDGILLKGVHSTYSGKKVTHSFLTYGGSKGYQFIQSFHHSPCYVF